MLEELSLTLPRLKFYEKTVSMDSEMETTLLAVYQEVICFYARAIHFFRSHKHGECSIAAGSYTCAQAKLQKPSYYATHGPHSAEIFTEPFSESSACPAPWRAEWS